MDSSFIFHLLNGVLMITILLTLAIVLLHRWKIGWRILLVGAATMVLSQIGYFPFNWLMSRVFTKTVLVHLSMPESLIFNAIFLGLIASFFEELFRYGMFRWWLKDARTWRKGILAGFGHGGVEAIFLGGLALFSMAQLVSTRNIDLSTIYQRAMLQATQAQVTAYWSMPWYDSLFGGIECILIIVVQISFSVLVVQCFIKKQKVWLWLAIGFHALVDSISVFAKFELNLYWGEGILGIFALLSLFIIFSLRGPEPVYEDVYNKTTNL